MISIGVHAYDIYWRTRIWYLLVYRVLTV